MHELEFSTLFQIPCKLASGRQFLALALLLLLLVGHSSEILGLKPYRAAVPFRYTQVSSRNLHAQCYVYTEMRSHKA
jgi:hypothetical protein